MTVMEMKLMSIFLQYLSALVLLMAAEKSVIKSSGYCPRTAGRWSGAN
jgi:hypothetical protein